MWFHGYFKPHPSSKATTCWTSAVLSSWIVRVFYKYNVIEDNEQTSLSWPCSLCCWCWRRPSPPPWRSPHPASACSCIVRLRMVKNTNFFWDSKKIILTYWKTVFWVTEHFCRKWTFWKNVIFCPKNAFFWQKWQFDPLPSAAQRRCQGTFFLGGNFTPIFEAKK